MDSLVDYLVLVNETPTKNAAVVLRAFGNAWRVPDKRSASVALESGRPPGTGGFWWARSRGGTAVLVRPAVQLIDVTAPRALTALLEDGKLYGAKPGTVVLRLFQGSKERWFGPVALARKGEDLDPTVQLGDEDVREIATSATPLASGRSWFLPVEWEPVSEDGAVSLIGKGRFYEWLAETLELDVLRRVEEASAKLPGALARVGLDASGELTLEDAVVQRLLAVPAIERAHRKALAGAQAKADALVSDAQARAEALLAEARGEVAELSARLEGLREAKREAILSALADLADDERALAMILALGPRPVTGPDLSGVERQLSQIARRPEPKAPDLRPLIEALGELGGAKPIDIEPLVRALQERPALDLSPLVDLVRPPSPVPSLTSLPSFDVSETCFDEPQVLEEEIADPCHRALLVVASAGLVGVVVGERAPETLHSLSRLALADRTVWWFTPGDVVDPRRILEDPLVVAVLNRAHEQPGSLFGLVLEGVDRAPTEAFLEPLLVVRDLRVPLPGLVRVWPPNLLLFATTTRGGRTRLPVAPGVWERAVPVPSSPSAPRPRRSSEIGANLWGGATRAPTGAVGTQNGWAAQNAEYLGFGTIPPCLSQGLAAARCLSTFRKPDDGVRESFPSLFAD